MRDTILRYARAADTQDVDTIEQVFHEHFQVVAHTADGMRVLTKPDYVQLLRDGKIGGSERKVAVIDMSDDGMIGTAKVRLTGNSVTFHDHLTLLKDGGHWQIVSNVTRITANDNT